ncbi:MAG: alpha/beta hydrolase [Bacteroidia bacterium]|nr:alpha/beta hydrolase [Bacteroidia bacterium]MCF8428148.1 alpha/beta hydrolase [Bacteroidia bacterium]MCF8447463.1 alpha/beta hydrolase [Bacteroidia bacterium]
MKKYHYVLLFVVLGYSVFSQSCMRMRMSDKEAKDEFTQLNVELKTESLQLQNKTFHFVQSGLDSNPTLLFVHGSPGSWDAYKGFMQDKDLLKKYRMISIDRLGFGYSEFGKSQNLWVHQQIISEFIQKKNNGKPVYLVGHSYGGPCIVAIAAINPQLVNGIVVLAGSVSPYLEKPENWRKIFLFGATAILAPGALRPSNEELWYLKKDLFELEPQLAKITCPVLIIHGTKDRLVPFENQAYLEAKLIHAKSVSKVILKEADHFIPWSHYDTVSTSMKAFLGALDQTEIKKADPH